MLPDSRHGSQPSFCATARTFSHLMRGVPTGGDSSWRFTQPSRSKIASSWRRHCSTTSPSRPATFGISSRQGSLSSIRSDNGADPGFHGLPDVDPACRPRGQTFTTPSPPYRAVSLLLDTNVVSELAKARPNAKVIAWLGSAPVNRFVLECHHARRDQEGHREKADDKPPGCRPTRRTVDNPRAALPLARSDLHFGCGMMRIIR